MVMAKASVKISKPSGFLKKHWWKIGISLLFLFGLVSFGYEKYLDRQNVADMKQLLSDFEKLKSDVESETGEKLLVGISCGYLEEKFTKTPSCYVYIESNMKLPSELTQVLEAELPERLLNNKSCGANGGTGFVFSNSKNVIFSCYPLIIREDSRIEISRLADEYGR
jgi:hypothetical protein